MLRVRKSDGTVSVVEKGTFVELCDLEGNVAQISFVAPDGGIRVLNSRDPEAQRYQALFSKCGVKLCPITQLKS